MNVFGWWWRLNAWVAVRFFQNNLRWENDEVTDETP